MNALLPQRIEENDEIPLFLFVFASLMQVEEIADKAGGEDAGEKCPSEVDQGVPCRSIGMWRLICAKWGTDASDIFWAQRGCRLSGFYGV